MTIDASDSDIPADSGPGDDRLIERFPAAQDDSRLRQAIGLSRKTEEAATRGLANISYGVSVLHGGRTSAWALLQMPAQKHKVTG